MLSQQENFFTILFRSFIHWLAVVKRNKKVGIPFNLKFGGDQTHHRCSFAQKDFHKYNMNASIIISSFIIVALSFVYFRIESVLSPVNWKYPNALPSFEGPTTVNSLLKNAIKITSGNFSGPESLAFDDDSGIVYASFNDGSVGSFSETGDYLSRVFFVGGFLNQLDSPTNGLVSQTSLLFNWCHDEAGSGRLAWNKDGEFRCGRPLGLRFRKVTSTSHLILSCNFTSHFILYIQ
jgi:hypothetical protein